MFGLVEVLEAPILSGEAAAAKTCDITQGSGTMCIARNDPYDEWTSSNILDETMQLVVTILRNSGSGGPQNSATAIALLQVRSSHHTM